MNKGVRLDGSTAVRARLIRFCSKYDRDKLDYVDGLLRKYAGKWEMMFKLLVDQYVRVRVRVRLGLGLDPNVQAPRRPVRPRIQYI